MKSRFVAVVVGTAALAAPAIAVAQEEGFLKVTGGGQVIADPSAGGPGDTIAFNAQQTEQQGMMDSAAAKGQLQVINRTAGRGQDQVKFHGTVTCIRTIEGDDGEMIVRFGGFGQTRGEEGTVPFTVDADDNDQSDDSGDEDDMIAFRRRAANEQDPCDDSDLSTELRDTRLARGNVKTHK